MLAVNSNFAKIGRISIQYAHAPFNNLISGSLDFFYFYRNWWGNRKGLTSHRVRAGHEIQRDGVGRVGGHALQVSLRDFVETVGRGGHIFIHPVQERVHA